MGRHKGRSRGEKELERLTNDLVVRAFFNRFKPKLTTYLKHLKITDQETFRSRIRDMRERGGEMLRKDWKFIKNKEEIEILKILNDLRKLIKLNENPHNDIELQVIEKMLFGTTPTEKFSGISCVFKDNGDRDENFYEWACIYIEPGAVTTDLRKFVDVYGESITNRLKNVLPKDSHLKRKMGAKKTFEIYRIIYDLRKKDVKFADISKTLKNLGFQVSPDYAQKILRRYKGT